MSLKSQKEDRVLSLTERETRTIQMGLNMLRREAEGNDNDMSEDFEKLEEKVAIALIKQ